MAKEQKTQEQAPKVEDQSLENFDWDTDGTGDFFGIPGTAPQVEEIVDETVENEEEKEEQEEGKEKPKSKKAEELNDEEFFKQEEVIEQEEEEKDFQIEEGYYKNLSTKLKEKGIFQNIEIPEEEDITEDKFIEFQDEEIEARVEGALTDFMEELDEDGKSFLKFKKDGGRTQDFFTTYKDSAKVPKGDLDDENYQEAISRYYYSNIEGMEPEDIDDRVQWLKDGGKLEKYAAKQEAKLQALEKKSKEDLQKQAKEIQKAQETARLNFVNNVKKTLDETDEVDNFKFTPKEKTELHSFITKPTIKGDNNKYLTGMQHKLKAALADPSKLLVLAKLLKNDFDVSDVIAATTTETTKKFKKNIQRAKTVKPVGSGRTTKRKNLADFF